MIDLKRFLEKLHNNLNTLSEREAKWAGDIPLSLLNQIKDHKQAINLTKQAIAGEITETEWRESLKPLLLAVQDGQVVNIETSIEGDVVAGDKVLGNKYIFQGKPYIEIKIDPQLSDKNLERQISSSNLKAFEDESPDAQRIVLEKPPYWEILLTIERGSDKVTLKRSQVVTKS